MLHFVRVLPFSLVRICVVRVCVCACVSVCVTVVCVCVCLVICEERSGREIGRKE